MRMFRTPRVALLLVNPKARNGTADIKAICAVLQEKNNITCIRPSTRKEKDLSKIIRAYARKNNPKIDMVIVGGGDGTLNNAAQGLIDTGLPLGILPLGTANDLARTLHIPLEPLAAAKRIGRDPLHTIDLGDVNGHPFFNVASVGLGADIAESLDPTLKKRWGVVGYMIGTWCVVMRKQPFRAQLSWYKQVERVRTFHIAVGNGVYYGGGLRVDTTSRPTDGKLHIYSLEARHWFGLLPLAPFMKFGLHGIFRSVRMMTAPTLTVTTPKPRPVNVDGELLTQTPATFSVLKGAIRVYAPKKKKRG